MRNRAAFLAACALAGLVGCESGAPVKSPTAPPAAAMKKKEPPPAAFRVKLETTKGDIVIDVNREWAPRGADHFYELVTAGFYDSMKFHRVMRTFVAQFGINGDPSIDQLYSAMRIPDDPPRLKNKRGTLTYAKLGPDSRTTEVFINLRDNPVLDSTGFAPFGKVSEGLEVADQLSFLYGELQPRGNGPDPAKIHREGNAYLNREFPRLDAIRKATILPAK